MTVCVAAICESGTILTASDRMITSQDVQFEPEYQKWVGLTNSIVAMVAGDSILQTEIIRLLLPEIGRRITANPAEWLNVRDAAILYTNYYNEIRQRRVETNILAPLFLDRQIFISRQQEMLPEFVREIGATLLSFEMPEIWTIIAGVDTSGPHIYVIRNADIYCYDAIGFAAIGIGQGHANSQFMLARHTTIRPLPQTLLLTYTAKKRAEVAPGVGTDTDMNMVGPQLGSLTPIGQHVQQELEKEYQKIRDGENRLTTEAEERIVRYVEELTEAAIAQAQTASPSPEPPEESDAGDPVN